MGMTSFFKGLFHGDNAILHGEYAENRDAIFSSIDIRTYQPRLTALRGTCKALRISRITLYKYVKG